MFDLNEILRDNIRSLKPYTSARDEYKGSEGIFLDANENSFGSTSKIEHNRYPDPLQWEMKIELARIKGCDENQVFVGNGSDEAIDLLFRCFCNPGVDNIIITPPTYGMYEVSANINDIHLKRVLLIPDFSLDENAVLKAVDEHTKMIILCSPNNPTGNCLSTKAIEKIVSNFRGIVVLDEAYIDFAPKKSFLPKLNHYHNLVVLHTFSKAWGLANLRLGLAFASKEIIHVLNKVKPPYNISGLSQKIALEAMKNEKLKDELVKNILEEREKLEQELEKLPFVTKIYPSDANFLLVKTLDGRRLYHYLIEHKVIVRDRSNVKLCEGCLRITVGTASENETLIKELKSFKG
ncbi:MAG: histidinol-phosphate transaminase [Bacteroidetes bacterium]|nr:MAG: histidinol-phosphate transaminase [Bacteroidota bacterium]